MAELIRIQWRDIPSQVIAKAGRKSAKRLLSDRFQQAIDRAAMRAGKGGSDAYMEDWQRLREPCEGNLDEAADRLAVEIEAAWSDEQLEALTKARGIAADVDSGS